MALLKAINCTLSTSAASGSNLDNDSTLDFNFHKDGDYTPYAQTKFSGRDGTGGSTREGDVKTFPLTLYTSTLAKEDISGKSVFHIVITAVGRDHYAGNLQAIFQFDDGTVSGFSFDFAVGTFHESHIASATVVLP